MARPRLLALLITSVLLLVAVVAAPATQAGGGCHIADGSVYTEGDGTSVIRMDTCSFSPTIARVPVGTSIRFLNTSTIDHAVVGRAGTFESQILSPGAEYSAKFAAAGTYPFSCPLHPGMVGAIVVGGEAAAAPAAEAPAIASTSATSPAEARGVDIGPLAFAGLAGLGIGAVAGVLAASAIATRRRRAVD